jgi:xylulokinase
MKQLIAAMDIGTSGCKSILIDETGAVVSSATESYPLYSPRPGWNEQAPGDWWKGAYLSLREAIAQSGASPENIRAVSLSGQMHGLVALDKNKNVIRRAFLWNDQRCAKQCADAVDLAGGLNSLLSYTNNNLLTGYQGGKILWLRETRRKTFKKCKRPCFRRTISAFA